MKTVEVFRNFDYRAHKRKIVRFNAGVTYRRVLERAAREIERAGAGRIVGADSSATGAQVDARNAFIR